MPGTSQVVVPNVPEIQLDDFAREYISMFEAGKHGPLLAKCMSDYKNNVATTDVCFKLDNSSGTEKILDKDGNEINLTDSQGFPITYDDMKQLGYSNGNVTFGNIQNNGNFVSYNFNPTNFINDWKDLRTSLGDIPLNEEDGTFNMSGLTSSRLDGYHDKFDETIRDKHKNILKKRNNLDNKMREMYGEKGDPDFNLDASVYSTMLFTIMTTSLLYYLFIKM